MDKLSRIKTIHKINDYATRGIPFVFLINFSGEENIVTTPEKAASAGFFLEMPDLVNHTFKKIPCPSIQLTKMPPDPGRYQHAFKHVIEQIHYGNSFLLNLTFPTQIECNYSLQDIFIQSRASFKLYLEDELVIFSPERFIRIQGESISSNPMKGTIDASIPGAHSQLASDPKEDAEHNTIVDLIRNDLSTVASQVRVRRFKYIEKLKTHQGELLQMSSEITGKLPADFRATLGDILFRLLPAGSICGAPKKKTLEIIREVEVYERGFYTGVFGYFDGQNLDSAVAIRYIEKQGKKLLFKSGGGITFKSDWEKEYDEMQKKVYVPVY
ncbi:MAG: aminodeoxychorismate synthase component I [Bacteroidetes bacterium]|nr:MAG: aminodeoxychorismate synthase component I [Bacteroidota bacterium]